MCVQDTMLGIGYFNLYFNISSAKNIMRVWGEVYKREVGNQ